MQLTAQRASTAGAAAPKARKGKHCLPMGALHDRARPRQPDLPGRPTPPASAAFGAVRPRTVSVRAQAAADDAAGTSRRSVLGASVALSAAAGMLPQLALPRGARANTVLSADWEQVGR